MATYLLDTDTLIHILRRRDDVDKAVLSRLRQALAENATVILSPIVFYEAYRGLCRLNATSQLRFLTALSAVLTWDDLQMSDWRAASDIWVEAMSRHRCPDDVDPIVAAHATRHGAVVITNNEKHFRELGIAVENWTKS